MRREISIDAIQVGDYLLWPNGDKSCVTQLDVTHMVLEHTKWISTEFIAFLISRGIKLCRDVNMEPIDVVLRRHPSIDGNLWDACEKFGIKQGEKFIVRVMPKEVE